MIPNIEHQAASILQKLPLSRLTKAAANVDVLRLDQLHPVVSGNKWFKLKYNFQSASEQGYGSVLTCGGIHSNHLHALASAGQYFGFKMKALVRGYANLPLTPTLLDCQAMGMDFEFVDKKTYLKRYDPDWCKLQSHALNSYWIPEGGNNDCGKKGCEEIATACLGYDEVWLSIGSGCTFIGLEAALPEVITLRGVMAIKGGHELGASLIKEALYPTRCEIDYDSSFSGFGRCPEELKSLILQYDKLGLPLDPVYTAKLIAAFEKHWQLGQLSKSKRYLLIHSGGLQGRRGVVGLS
jgi:1-aminocyclopropane-1-carboxylate deaminase